jgi:4-aminobutyrate aminotransferase
MRARALCSRRIRTFSAPVAIVTLPDTQERKYLDFHGNNVHRWLWEPEGESSGHGSDGRAAFCTRRYANRHAIALARKLAAISPGNLDKCLFAPGGTEAISMAVKLARLATGRFKTISHWDSFHGATLNIEIIEAENLPQRAAEQGARTNRRLRQRPNRSCMQR